MPKYRLFLSILISILSTCCAGCAASSSEESAGSTDKSEPEQIDVQEEEEEQEQQEEPTERIQKEGLTYQDQPRTLPTEEHDKQMLAMLDEACGSNIYVYASLDMDKDGKNEMIGVTYDYYSVWYCSSDLEDCYMIPDEEIQDDSYYECRIEQIEFDEEAHVVINIYDVSPFGWPSYSILALHDGEIEMLVEYNTGYVYPHGDGDILLDIEAYDGEYYGAEYDLWMGHTWKDTYLYYEDGEYREYGAAELSEEAFFRYDNAQELMDEIEEEHQHENVVGMRYSYLHRENGIVYIQCEEEWSGPKPHISYFFYALRENGNHLDWASPVHSFSGIMRPSLSQLEVTYP